jgi:predicted PurR-regulated permease PerM
MGGYAAGAGEKESRGLAYFLEVVADMLQWKPRLIALVAVLVIVAALLGQFTWESIGPDALDQLTW